MLRALLSLPIVLLVAACFPFPTEPPIDVLPTPPPDAPVDAPLASIRVTGGIAFRDTLWTVATDGTVIETDLRAQRIQTKRLLDGPAGAARLAEQLRASGVTAVASGRFGPQQHCCDRQEYDLTIVLDGKLYRFVTIDGETAPAPVLEARRLVLAAARSAG
ncbi:MAG: hypothetical protein U0556_06765 [Dehalococcoidia bacterium]